jgi:hypothetical protein
MVGIVSPALKRAAKDRLVDLGDARGAHRPSTRGIRPICELHAPAREGRERFIGLLVCAPRGEAINDSTFN